MLIAPEKQDRRAVPSLSGSPVEHSSALHPTLEGTRHCVRSHAHGSRQGFSVQTRLASEIVPASQSAGIKGVPSPYHHPCAHHVVVQSGNFPELALH